MNAAIVKIPWEDLVPFLDGNIASETFCEPNDFNSSELLALDGFRRLETIDNSKCCGVTL